MAKMREPSSVLRIRTACTEKRVIPGDMVAAGGWAAKGAGLRARGWDVVVMLAGLDDVAGEVRRGCCRWCCRCCGHLCHHWLARCSEAALWSTGRLSRPGVAFRAGWPRHLSPRQHARAIKVHPLEKHKLRARSIMKRPVHLLD